MGELKLTIAMDILRMGIDNTSEEVYQAALKIVAEFLK